MRDDTERAKLHVDIHERNHALLNRQPEQATAKREQQAGAGTYRDYASCLRVAHRALRRGKTARARRGTAAWQGYRANYTRRAQAEQSMTSRHSSIGHRSRQCHRYTINAKRRLARKLRTMLSGIRRFYHL